MPDQGTFENDTYTNAYLGLKYKLPSADGWFVNSETIQQDASRTNKMAGRFLLTVLDRHTGSPMRERVVIMADDSSLYHPPLSSRTYVEKVTSAQAKLGNEVPAGVRELPFHDVHGNGFFRGDFTEAYPGGKVYKSFVAVEVGGFFVSFTFAAGSADALNNLVGSISQLTFVPAIRPATNDVQNGTRPTRVRISQMVLQALIVSRPVPSYPEDARNAGVEGPVVLRINLNETGELMDAQVISGDLLLRKAALDAIRYWRFKPYVLNGSPVQVESQVTIDFRLGKNRKR